MFEVHQGNIHTIERHWRGPKNQSEPVYRFQSIDHPLEASTTPSNLSPYCPTSMEDRGGRGDVNYRSSSNTNTTAVRIQQLCTSLQSLLDNSRSKDRRQKSTSTYTIATRKSFAPPRNYGVSQTQLYLDSGGTLHGPLDLKHSAKLDGVKKSYETFGHSRQQLTNSWKENPRSQSTGRNLDAHSDMNLGVYTQFDTKRTRTSSESRGKIGAQIDGLLDDLNRMGRTQQYRTVASHDLSGSKAHLTRCSSLQAVGDSGGRYATTLTRRHVKKGGTAPVEFLVKHPMSAGVSKVDLLSIENRNMHQDSRQPITLHLQTSPRNAVEEERERRLLDELVETRRELQRTRSMMAEEGQRGLVQGSTTLRVPVGGPGGSNQYLNTTNTWSARNFKKEIPTRTFSQTNVHNLSSSMRNNWTSENNLGNYTKPLPFISSYSAHQANLRQNNGINQRRSSRHSEIGVGEIYQESVTLQPIGPGVHDLEASPTFATLPRATSHTAGRSNSLGGEGQQIRSNFYSGTQSPNLQHRGFEHRSRTTRNEASQWRHVNGVASSFESINGSFAQNHVGDSLDARSSMIQVQELSHHWFRPKISRDEAQGLLINRPPGNFIVCQSRTQPEYYVLVLRVPSTANEREPVRSFFMERNQVGVGESFHLRGYASEPTYPSLVAFVHEHIKSQGALPVRLRLPKVSGETRSLLGGQSPSWRPTNGNMSTGGEFTSDVLYLASLDVFPLNDVSAVRRAVQQTLADANNPNKGLRKKCEATVQLVSSGSGSSLVITDKTGGARFTKKTIEGHRILYCGYDPEQRIFNSTELRNKGIVDSQIFGIVVKKKRFAITEHAVYVMCQLESNQPSSNLINFINQIVLGGTTQSQHRR